MVVLLNQCWNIDFVYTFSAYEFFPKFLLIYYQDHHLLQCAKWCDLAVNIFKWFLSIPANIRVSNNKACTFCNRMIGQILFSISECNILFLNARYLSWSFVGISVNCSSYDGTLFNGGVSLFNSNFWTLDSIALFLLVTSNSLLHWLLLMICSEQVSAGNVTVSIHPAVHELSVFESIWWVLFSEIGSLLDS